jgi:hypothetical protein
VHDEDGGLEPARVERVVGKAEQVGVPRPQEHVRRGARGAVRLERRPGPGDVHVQRAGGIRRRVAAPEQLAEQVDRHRPPVMQREGGEQRSLLRRPRVHLAAVPLKADGPEHVHPHARDRHGAEHRER